MRFDRDTVLTRLLCALAVATSAGVFTAAALVPAPPAVLPLVVLVAVGCAMLAAWELRPTVGGTRRTASPLGRRAEERLRRQLDELPETQHPLGF
jgi:hypothetical protein